jgi:hypothetical protein
VNARAEGRFREALRGSSPHLAGALRNRAELQRLLGMPLAVAAALREVVPLMERARDQASVAAVGVQAGDQHLEASVPFLHSAIAIAMRASPARLAVGHWWRMLGDIIVRLGAEGANGCYLVAHDYLEAELGPHHAHTLAVKRLLEPASR